MYYLLRRLCEHLTGFFYVSMHYGEHNAEHVIRRFNLFIETQQ